MDTRGSFPRLKKPERKADHSLPADVELKKIMDLYIHFPYVFMA
jgi:hypothetical protein